MERYNNLTPLLERLAHGWGGAINYEPRYPIAPFAKKVVHETERNTGVMPYGRKPHNANGKLYFSRSFISNGQDRITSGGITQARAREPENRENALVVATYDLFGKNGMTSHKLFVTPNESQGVIAVHQNGILAIGYHQPKFGSFIASASLFNEIFPITGKGRLERQIDTLFKKSPMEFPDTIETEQLKDLVARTVASFAQWHYAQLNYLKWM